VTKSLAKLENLAASEPYALVGGPFGSKLISTDYVDEGIPVIRGSNLNGGRYLEEDDFVYVSEQKMREDLFGNLAHPGDLVFTQRGTLGQVAIIPDNSRFDTYVISQSQMKLTVDKDKADARFIYYFFSSREAVRRILNQNSSSGVRTLILPLCGILLCQFRRCVISNGLQTSSPLLTISSRIICDGLPFCKTRRGCSTASGLSAFASPVTNTSRS